MVQQTESFKAFVKLGAFLRDYTEISAADGQSATGFHGWYPRLEDAIVLAGQRNAWFTRKNINIALSSWGEALREENIIQWLSGYDLRGSGQKKVAIIMAGNIPLVGLHDFLSVLITGNKALVKASADDRILLPLLADFLISENPGFKESIEFVDSTIKGFDAVIATGSNNTARYFEYYFGKKPLIIRKNRNSAAIIQGDESPAELYLLGKDIFTYFGLGCRNVAKLYVPDTYDFNPFLKAISGYSEVALHSKYANNYDYNKAVYLMSGYPIIDNGFMLLREASSYTSPIGTLNFERYNDPDGLKDKLENDRDEIQCIVGRPESGAGTRFGNSQHPALWDYADGVDTVDFLLKTKQK